MVNIEKSKEEKSSFPHVRHAKKATEMKGQETKK